MISKPSQYPRWASNDVISPVTGVNNVINPPESKKNVGWLDGEPPARNYFNWLHRTTNEWVEYFDNRDKTLDGQGIQAFSQNSLCVLYAVTKTNPSQFIYALGFRSTGAPVLNVIASNGLSIGSTSSDGSVSISGAPSSDIILVAQSRN